LPSSETTRYTKDLTGRFDLLAVTASQGENSAIVGALTHLGEFGPLPERNHQSIIKLRKQPFNRSEFMQTGHIVHCTPRPQEKIDCE
jgi:hypothetical protein